MRPLSMFCFYFIVLVYSSTFCLVLARDTEVNVVILERLLQMGDQELSAGDVSQAISHYETGFQYLSVDPTSIVASLSLCTNLGTAYSALGSEEQAQVAYRKALNLHSDGIQNIHKDDETKKIVNDLAAQASFYLGMTYQDSGEAHKAVESYKYAVDLDPLHWASLANLGSVLQDKLKKYSEALEAYQKAYNLLTLKLSSETEPTDLPTSEDMPLILSNLQYYIGLCITYAEKQKCILETDPKKEVPCSEMAAHAFDMALKLNPNNEAAQHMLAAVTADATFLRASNTYVKQLFEDYAENFEHSLVNELGYNGYERLRQAFNKAFDGVENVPIFKQVVDAGCGTGLVGAEFRNISQYLVGADLSPSIIEEAKKTRPNLYNETKVGDVAEIFISMKNSISLIIAADSYIYFGDLVPLFSSMETGLVAGGFVAFTLENVSQDNEKRSVLIQYLVEILNLKNFQSKGYYSLQITKSDWKWQLTPSGRFAHRKEYVEHVGKEHSFETIYYEPMNDFRREGAVYVRGHIFIMKKKTKDSDEL